MTPIGGAAPTEGALVAMDADTISLHPGLSRTLITMPLDSVRAVDLSLGRYASFGKVVRGGAIGLVAGVGIVALVGNGICSHGGGEYCGVDAALLAVPIGVLGLVTGVAIARSHKTDQWQRVYDRPTTALLIGPVPHGRLSIGVSIAFGSAP